MAQVKLSCRKSRVMKHVIYMTQLCQGVEISVDISTVESV